MAVQEGEPVEEATIVELEVSETESAIAAFHPSVSFWLEQTCLG